ncbi:MAG: MarR family winged helix-turn-helix transcriptional regulator [Eubacteriales bacterium]
MATKEEIREGMRLFHENRPHHAFDEMREHESGTIAVLKFLSEQETNVKSKDISSALGISTARMAVLLKKMERKGFIIKTNSQVDGRITIVSLSEQGHRIMNTIHQQMECSIEKLVDQFGLDKIRDVFQCMNEFKGIIHEGMHDNIRDELIDASDETCE